jgi:hypothetical protein
LPYATTLAAGRDDALITLVNVQGSETLEVSDVSAVMSRKADRQLAARRSKTALRKADRICRDAQVKFETRVELGQIAETIDRLARAPARRRSDRDRQPRAQRHRQAGSRLSRH